MGEQFQLDFGPSRRVFSVTEITAAIRQLLSGAFSDVWVAGEISGVKAASSGHYYFTLKDGQAQMRCVCFRPAARLLRFKPQDGIAVLARGRVEVYEPRGEYQLLVETIEPQGYGALQLAFEQLKKKLAEEGLFDAARKRPLPTLPGRIGIVTSPTGAVIRDILQILERRFPGLHIRVYPAQVQGAGSIEEVCAGIDYFSQSGWPDVVIVARGGGSLEDLWTFNEEAVARAIARSAVPVISAVGHETDVTIADFVADLRAPTPSAAAELVIPAKHQLLEKMDTVLSHLARVMRYQVFSRWLQRADEIDFRLRSLDPRLRLATSRRRLEMLDGTLCERTRLRMVRERARLDGLAAVMAGLSPLGILQRGYAIVQDEAGNILKDAETVPPNTLLDVRLAGGSLRATVTEKRGQ